VKVVILAGGLGTRLSEETELKPKPMVEIGGRPILWHITKHYASFGHKEFFVALGYKGEAIKRFFLDYQSLSGSMTIDLADGRVNVHSRDCEGWTVHLMDTGMETNTGGRVKRLEPWLREEPFMLFDGDLVREFTEKPQIGEGWINGGFMVFEPAVFDYLEGDGDSLEADALEQLARVGQLAAYRHERFWQCMDTLRDKRFLESLWQEGRAPWKVWD
jgi:glucose-1-phosphate cytidylyltransferase